MLDQGREEIAVVLRDALPDSQVHGGLRQSKTQFEFGAKIVVSFDEPAFKRGLAGFFGKFELGVAAKVVWPYLRTGEPEFEFWTAFAAKREVNKPQPKVFVVGVNLFALQANAVVS